MKKTLLLFISLFTVIACTKQKSKKTTVPVKDPDYVKAKKLFFSNNKDSAFYYFNKVATNTKDSLRAGNAYNYMASIQSSAGDYFGAQESLLTSLKFLNEKNPDHFRSLSSDYNELGTTSLNLKNYEASIRYFESVAKFSDDTKNKLIGLNNKALVYATQGKYKIAIQLYSQVLSTHEQTKKEYARALANLSFTKWLDNPSYNAESDLLESSAIREADKDLWGQNSSYSHLADYYTDKKPATALLYADRMYQIAKHINSPDDRLEALQKLIKLSPPINTKKYFKIYQNLSDSLQTARNAAKNQFALIRYDAEKNKTENLKLQKDNNEKQYQIATRESLLFGSITLLILVSVVGILWYKKRKQKMELQAQNALRNSQLKTSRRVHDVVANGLYRVMKEIENRPTFDKENLLDKIEDLYEQSRDISYEKPTISKQNFDQVISELLTSFATDETKILIAGNTPELWKNVSDTIKYELEHILQELLVNMKKHSQATNVALKFEHYKGRIIIYYIDNGVGMPNGVQENNGIRNTGNRIATVGGAIIFDTKVEKGLKIQITFPNP